MFLHQPPVQILAVKGDDSCDKVTHPVGQACDCEMVQMVQALNNLCQDALDRST